MEQTLSFSTNYPYDAEGEPDSRPGCWGKAAYDDGKITFKDVPAGHRVRITRVYGDFVAWPHGAAAPGKYGGCLFGLMASDSTASPYADLASSGCMLYLQTAVGADQARAHFDVNTEAAGLLAEDHVLVVRRAVFLNELGGGVSIHMEPSFVLEFRHEEINPQATEE